MMRNVNQEISARLAEHFRARYGGDIRVLAVSGSQAAGLANSKSDVDAMVLFEPDAIHDLTSERFHVDFVGSKRLELLVVSEDLIADAVSTIQKGEFARLSHTKLRLLERIVSASPIIGHAAWAHLVPKSLEGTYTVNIQEQLLAKSIAEFDDFCGAYLNGDYISALDFVRELIKTEMTVLLAGRGEVYLRRKWISAIVSRNQKTNNVERSEYFEAMHRCVSLETGALKGKIERVLRYHQRLNVELLEEPRFLWHDSGAAAIADAGDDVHVARSILLIRRSAENYLVKTEEQHFSVDRHVAALLAAFSTPVATSAVRRFVDHYKDAIPGGAEALLKELRDAGLLAWRGGEHESDSRTRIGQP